MCGVLNLKGNPGPYTIYDPFCGVAYALTSLGFLHGKSIKKIYASDADQAILEFASKNLSLLYETGMEKRIQEFQTLIKKYDKTSIRKL
jgi:tRNA G10  N-methylase Trm11